MNALAQPVERDSSLELVHDPERPWLELWLGPHAKCPPIIVHAGLPPPKHCTIEIGAGSDVSGAITVWGEHPKILIGHTVLIRDSQICCGDTAEIVFGSHTHTAGECNYNARHGGSILIGEDCMISNQCVFLSDDMHRIHDVETGARINPRGGTIVLERHVWIGFDSLILGGSFLGEGSIVSARSTTHKTTPPNAMLAGNPARVVRKGVSWSQADLP